MKCKVCSREAEEPTRSSYCELHQKAYENVQSKFEAWKKALSIAWKDYLNEVVKNSFTGTWAREVAKNLLSEMEKA